MKLTDTVYVSEWVNGSGWSYEDVPVSIEECDLPYLLHCDSDEFDCNDDLDLFASVDFSISDDGVVCSISELVFVLKCYDNIDDVSV